MQRCITSDVFGVSSRTITPEGYLIANGTIAASDNVQAYGPGSLIDPSTGKAIPKALRLYRPSSEVSAADTIASFANVPIVNGHKPGTWVNAKNWKDLGRGEVMSPAFVGKGIDAQLFVRDQAAVDAVTKAGKDGLSCGYTFDIDMTPGVTADGQSYDGVQRNIRGNHVSIEFTPRGGPTCRVADTKTGDTTMALRHLAVDGLAKDLSVELDDSQFSIVDTALSFAANRVKTATDAAEAVGSELAEAKKKIAAADAAASESATKHAEEIANLKGQILSADAIEKAITEGAAVLADAKTIAPELKTAGLSTSAIRSAAVDAICAADKTVKSAVDAVVGGHDMKTSGEKTEALRISSFNLAVQMRKAGTGATATDAELGKAFGGGDGSVVRTVDHNADLLAFIQNNGKIPEKTRTRA